ncbi:putative methyltransferase-domain-containing protein [Rhodocollybia butyracea]|uniref:Methyltransferase-domain-containing protein n=1 Tax=Rhodocollybia butyracea TaxID=206335 RepID=A0A9P5QAZ1_9AGAR|nr:putative methyltransferase-domain-containing protein [Rhodocollybia butyracea]
MFYYISFLRPPPLQIFPSSLVSITPQIANDLRTELFEDSQDLYYAWCPGSSDGNSANLASFVTTKPAKLTTWRQANAYKEIAVVPPPGARDGQSWRLILSPEPQYISINLGELPLGTKPFPVISMPIMFATKARKSFAKQERIERYYRFSVGNLPSANGNENPALDPTSSKVSLALKITEQTSFDLDKKIWDSGIGLSSWLVSLVNNHESVHEGGLVSKLKDILFNTGSCRIIELGAGTGIVALTLGALRSTLIKEEGDNGCITTTDLPSAMPLLEHNISANSHLFSRASGRPRPEVLDWDKELPSYTQTLRGQLDAIVMADVTYNTASFPALIRTLTNLIALNAMENPPIILLGYKERDAAERTLWSMAEEIGIHFDRVGERQGAGGAPIEIWIGVVSSTVNPR